MAKRALGCLFFILFPGLIGMYIGLRIADRKVNGLDNPWPSTPLPEGAIPSNFVGGLGSVAYIRSTDGRIFFQELMSYRDYPTWQEIDEIIPEDSLGNRLDDGGCNPVPVGPHPLWRAKPHSGSIAQLDCWHAVHSEVTVYIAYVILEGGDVQRWINRVSDLESLGIYLIGMAFGAFIAAALGLLLYGVIQYRRGRDEMVRLGDPAGEIVGDSQRSPPEPRLD